MPNKLTAGIQTDYVVEVITEVETQQEDHVSGDVAFELVRQKEFIQLFKKTYPDSIEDPSTLWNTLFGHDPSGDIDGLNMDVRYLTTDSCQMILAHYSLFKSGIDFQHLPAGFFLTKNPLHGGVRDVLHYSDYLATHNPKISPLAITLSKKNKNDAVYSRHGFSGSQGVWYEFLLSKMQSKSTLYCNEKELHKAFIAFSNTLSRLKLEFFDFNFSSNPEEVNPIVLLGRWETILTQPHLKSADLSTQWKQLPQLYLNQGYSALRGITDYQNTENPCGFLLTTMFSKNSQKDKFSELNTTNDISNINSELTLWRYLAYQSQRNSIQFYNQALEIINKVPFTNYQKERLIQILIASTTGSSHMAKNEEEEQNELATWSLLCTLIDTMPHRTYSMKLMTQAMGGGDLLKENVILHLYRLTKKPNIPFLLSIANCIQEHIENLNPVSVGIAIAKRVDPLADLVKLSDTLNELISHYNNDFYEGAQFYFVKGKWEVLGVQKYVELQHVLHQINPNAAKVILPYLSTFTLVDNASISDIVQLISDKNPNIKHLNYCLSLFKDIKKPLKKEALAKIITEVNSISNTNNSLIPLLEYVETHFKDAFPDHYFPQKKQQLIDAQYGINDEQIRMVKELHFSDPQNAAIILIESALVRINNKITNEQLAKLNEQFVNLRRIIIPADFTLFTERLASVREYLPEDPAILGELLTLLSKNRSLEGFSQLYFRNTIEKCHDNSLIPKFNLFVKTIKPLSNTKGIINTQIIQDVLATIVLNCHLKSTQEFEFTNKIERLLQSLNKIAESHPHVQGHLLDAFNHITDKHSFDYFNNIQHFEQCINSITTILKAGENEEAQKDMLVLYSLLANFHDKPMQLSALWDQIKELEDPEQQQFLLKLVNSLVENNQSIDGLAALVNILKTQDGSYEMLAKECIHPPFPAIDIINDMLIFDNFEQQYQDYSMHPFGNRRYDFAYDRKLFNKQKTKFIGAEENLFTPQIAQSLDMQIKNNRDLSVQALRQTFNDLKSKAPLTNEQKLTLLCVCIEMLARTTAQIDSKTGTLISQEVNTTQVMALYAMLTHSNPKLISEVDTGEGKSRIMMILAACQVAQGKTVDFMTSDMSLAERDFLAYNAFFTSLGIRTSLISLTTPKQLYQKGGINFSDNSQLLLLRNRSDILLEPFAYQDEDSSKRCLLIDEVDKFTHDKSKDSYNYAAKSKKLMSFVWIYPLLINYVQEKTRGNPNVELNANLLIDEFVQFTAIHDSDELHLASLSSLKNSHRNQIITWINAAQTALKMEQDKHYKVTEGGDSRLFAVRDTEGFTRYTRKVLVLDNGRPVEGSTFSDGVQQCLCALENQKSGKEDFIIQPENETQRASYPVSFMSQYDNGATFGMSGTTRRDAPSASKTINYENVAYLLVPRHQSLRREDKNIWAAKNEQQQIEFIKKSILEKLQETPPRPVLLICKNDQQSKALYDALSTDHDLIPYLKQLTRVHGLTEKKDELTAIQHAGKSGSLTISTAGMFGRGVDINSDNLYVISAYVPTLEDEKQIKGRTGRAGKPGEYRMIPNLTDPDHPVNGATYNIENEVDKVQKEMALSAVSQEEVSKLYAAFLEHVTQNFLLNLSKKDPINRLKYLETWQKYLDNLQKDWDDQKHQLMTSIEEENQTQFTEQFSKFTKKWLINAPFKSQSDQQMNASEKATTIYNALLDQKGFFKHQPKPLKVQRHYDVSDDGQARIYSTLFAQTFATLRGERRWFADYHAWREGRGELFPDLMATLRGERPIFANLRATIARLIAELKAWFSEQWGGESPASPLIAQNDDIELVEEALVIH